MNTYLNYETTCVRSHEERLMVRTADGAFLGYVVCEFGQRQWIAYDIHGWSTGERFARFGDAGNTLRVPSPHIA